MSAYIPADLRRRVATHFAHCCAYCRTAERLTVAIFEIEHIVPRAASGKTVFENLCLSCPTCNRHKARRSFAEDPDSKERVALFHPHHDKWYDHFAWTEDTTQITGLTATGRATVMALRMNRHQLTRVRRMWIALGEHPPDLDELD